MEESDTIRHRRGDELRPYARWPVLSLAPRAEPPVSSSRAKSVCGEPAAGTEITDYRTSDRRRINMLYSRLVGAAW